MKDLITKFENACGKKVKETYNFPANGTFGAYYEAKKVAKGFGFGVAPMCCDEPIAMVKDFDFIAKWRNIAPSDRSKVEGGLLSTDFREGSVLMVIFE